MPEKNQKKHKVNNAVLFYIIGAILLLMALWKLADELLIGFQLPEAELESYGPAQAGWADLRQIDVLERGGIRVFMYESQDGKTAAATAFSRGLLGKYKLVSSLEPGAGARELQVQGGEERLLLQIQPGAEISLQGQAQQTWFGLVIMNLILAGLAFFSGWKQAKAKAAQEN